MSSRRSPSLEIPRKPLEDAGAHELEQSDTDEEHFSDAQEGRASGAESPIPTTRVTRVDDRPAHGEIPGTTAYTLRTEDAVPDQVDIRGRSSRESSLSRPGSAASGPIPITVVEKVDPDAPSHGEVPGTAAHQARRADAVPDMVFKTSERLSSVTDMTSRPRSDSTPGDLPIPTTKVSKISTGPAHGEVPGTLAHQKRVEDAEPDAVEEVEGPSLSVAHRSVKSPTSLPHQPPDDQSQGGGNGDPDNMADFDEDFDDFEDGAGADDFGDFDDGIEDSHGIPKEQYSFVEQKGEIFATHLLDFDEFDSPSEVTAAATKHFGAMFNLHSFDELDDLPTDGSVFLTDRSASLWAQLVAPPPIQPPNWLRSRIRRLFLVSLGVPVDLDEILPASKQKKLILPSARAEVRGSTHQLAGGHAQDSPAKLQPTNGSNTSHRSRSKSKQRKETPALVELDKDVIRKLCSYTPETIGGLSDEELNEYIAALEEQKAQAIIVLEYWLKQKDAALGDKEAFEGVIENLVRHARKIRK